MTTTTIDTRSIANYRIIELIGTGGMANIYKAIQLSLDRPVALKILHSHLLANENFVARFEKEAKQAALLQHENIVSIIDCGHDNGQYYIAMEYVDGKNLREILEKQRRLPLEICLLICHQVAGGLKYAHSHNLVHRDIKPANIVLSCDGRVMITDFGIAKTCDDLSITATGLTIGSPAYMSPEQAAGKPTDHRSDIFSLGIILYEMISGERPFKGDTYQSMVAAIVSQKPTSLMELRVDVTPEIELLVEKALVKVADSRFQTAEEFSEAIYAQLSNFKIPPTGKLISAYLKNPIKITERLRADKISDHMESALYSLTLGETKLAEAKREFQEVLRFDKNNKSAKQHLSRLESYPGFRWATRNLIGKGFRVDTALVSLVFVIVVVSLIFIATLPRGSKSTTKVRERTPDITLLAPEPDAAGNTGSLADRSKSANSQIGALTPEKSLAKTLLSDEAKKAVAGEKKASYNYPKQELARFGLLIVRTNVTARIDVDNMSYGRTNGPAIKLAPGRHFIEVQANGYRKESQRVFIEKDGTINLRFDLKSVY